MLAEKRHPELPETITNIIKCKNPRCITTTEQELPQVFKLTDREKARLPLPLLRGTGQVAPTPTPRPRHPAGGNWEILKNLRFSSGSGQRPAGLGSAQRHPPFPRLPRPPPARPPNPMGARASFPPKTTLDPKPGRAPHSAAPLPRRGKQRRPRTPAAPPCRRQGSVAPPAPRPC